MKDLPFARGPRGVRTTVTTTAGSRVGELLEARPGGLVLQTDLRRRAEGPGFVELEERRIVFVRFAAVREARFQGLGESLRNGATPKPEQFERLRRLSRFPQGLTPELLEALLRDCDQQQVDEERP